MKNILLLLLISISLFANTTTYSQGIKTNPIDKRFKKLETILKDKYPTIKKDQLEITVFSNKKCGKCNKFIDLLRKKKIPFMVYDLKIQKNGDLMRKLCYKKAGKQNIGIMYPVVLLNNEVHYKIKNIPEFVNIIETKYLSIKQVNKP